jgi:hypothetical protein
MHVDVAGKRREPAVPPVIGPTFGSVAPISSLRIQSARRSPVFPEVPTGVLASARAAEIVEQQALVARGGVFGFDLVYLAGLVMSNAGDAVAVGIRYLPASHVESVSRIGRGTVRNVFEDVADLPRRLQRDG